MQKISHLLFILLILPLLAACVAGPNYKRPLMKVPAEYKEAKGKSMVRQSESEWKRAHPQDIINRGEWWKIFQDAKLNSLEQQLNASNQSILNAFLNYQQANALVDEARANYFPILSGSLTLTRQKSGGGTGTFNTTSGSASSTGTFTSSGGGSSTSKISTIHTVAFNASWEPDIWGLVHRTVEASAAGASASKALYAATRLSSQAALAQYYFELRGLDKLQALLNRTVRDYQASLRLTQQQYRAGVVSRADIVQAQSLLEAAEANAINNGIARGQYEHAIAVLIGLAPAQFSISPSPLNAAPPAIPLGLPSALLERRPDIAQAERLMAQTNAQIGVAEAAYFPSFSLTGSAAVNGTGLSHWFSLPALGWAYGPQLSQLIYDGGLRSATVRAAQAGYLASVASYRQTVLTALQDVEDNLISLRLLNEQAAIEKQAVNSAKWALQIVRNQYKAGTVPYANVITAEINAFNIEQTSTKVEYLRLTSAVLLIKALGGGWQMG